ncbi:MAG TPA: TonB-dependent receptor [Vicinamibacterales bacterium]|nr:TonB-dependent receptor [Vicinamibacterales bacterium]
MWTCSRCSAVALVGLLILPAASFAQAAITGVVRDPSGGVLPGVTVEAASPALIEKVRSVSTDGTGQYRIVDLRTGTYTVTFSLPGFSTVRRDGIALSGDFVATVSAELRVGALEETVTVTGESPTVDVQSARVQTIVDRDVIAAIPSSRNATGIQSLVPGMSSSGDSGGITGGTGGMAGFIHGARASDSRTLHDGINTGWAGANSNAAISNVAGSQEVVLTTSGGLGEAETAGAVLNVIPRDGGNTFSGTLFMSGADGSWQGSNYTQALRDAGLRSPQELRKVFEFNPMGGGRIIRDKLWFYATYRSLTAENTVPGMFSNRNAGDPTKWVVDFDTGRAAYNDNVDRNAIARLTWQISPRNKLSLSHSQQYSRRNADGGGQPTRTPEAVGLTLYNPGFVQTASWASPFTNRLLFEAGWADYFAKYANSAPRIDGTHNNAMISVVEQCSNATLCPQFGGIPNLVYRLHQPLQQGFENHQIGTLAQMRASVSYIPGAHSLKFGYQGNVSHPSQSYFNFTPFIQYRFNNGVPNRLTQTGVYPGTVKFQRNILMTSFYAQDTYTRARLTLQGGIRYDGIGTGYPDTGVGGPEYQLMPTRIFYAAGTTDEIHWRDITPRIGAAYDLFGSGRTAVKFNIGKYVTALTASNSDLDLHPLIRTTLQTTRTWNDANTNFIPDCDLVSPDANRECGRMDQQNFGQETFTKIFDPELINGWGKRTYNWEMGVSVQQELLPRVGLTVGYVRRWFGNFYTADNTQTTAADYTPFSIPIPVDPRLPGGGGGTVSGLYNLVPGKVGQEVMSQQLASNFGEMIENWHGLDLSLNARLRNGLTLQGGTSTGRRMQDNCAIRAVLPETYSWDNTVAVQTTRVTTTTGSTATSGLQNYSCRVVEPMQTSFRGLASYVIPKVDVQVSGTWRSDPGNELRADYVVTNAIASPSLGRNLSSGNVTVNLIPRGTVYGARVNNVDLRIAKILRLRGTRMQFGADVYNLLNTDVVTGYNNGYSAPTPTRESIWLTPTAILPARYVRLNMQLDF